MFNLHRPTCNRQAHVLHYVTATKCSLSKDANLPIPWLGSNLLQCEPSDLIMLHGIYLSLPPSLSLSFSLRVCHTHARAYTQRERERDSESVTNERETERAREKEREREYYLVHMCAR